MKPLVHSLIRNLDAVLHEDGTIQVGVHPERDDSGASVSLHPNVALSIDAEGKSIVMANNGKTLSPLDFTVTTKPVTVLGPIADVGPCIHPKWWSRYLTGVEAKDIDPAWDGTSKTWSGTIWEVLGLGEATILETKLQIDYELTESRAVTKFSMLESKGDVLFKDEGEIVATRTGLGLTELQITKHLSINPDAPEAILGKLAKPLTELILQAWMTEFAITYVIEGPPNGESLVDVVEYTEQQLADFFLPFKHHGRDVEKPLEPD